jgi:prepilin-type N-terminal cleavage/methylation domain-containing protein
MGQKGFSLIELVVTIGVITILLAIATLEFNKYMTKSNIESQAKMMYSDMMTARAEALLQKSDRSIKVDTTAKVFSIHPSSNGSGTPLLQKTLNFPLDSDNGNTVAFDTRGVANITKIICVGVSGNPAAVDSIIITETRIQLGKRTGGTCSSANITAK